MDATGNGHVGGGIKIVNGLIVGELSSTASVGIAVTSAEDVVLHSSHICVCTRHDLYGQAILRGDRFLCGSHQRSRVL